MYALLILALLGSESAIESFEAHEETCAGYDGIVMQGAAEQVGWCRYFEVLAAQAGYMVTEGDTFVEIPEDASHD